MRFVHAADIHLDSPLRGLAAHDSAPVERMRLATREAFERMIDLCIKRQAAFLILAGDLYDRDCPNMQIAVFLRSQLTRLRNHGIRVVIEKGNHDADNRITSALDLPDNVRILSDRAPETISYDDLEVAIHGQSFKRGPVSENLAAAYPAAIAGRLNIGVLHTSLGGYSEHDPYAPCALTDLTTRGYVYWALGHVHKSDVLARDPCWVVFPGNIQGRHARETGPKGCVVVETEGDRVTAADAIPVDGVRWHQAEIDLHNARLESDLVDRLRDGLSQAQRSAEGRLCATRVVLVGRTPLHADIAKRPVRLRQTVDELADEIAGDDLWIEKIRNDTTPLVARATGPLNDVAAELIGIIREIADDPAQVGPLLKDALDPLRAKLPEDLKELPALKLLEDPGLAGEALARLEPLMRARLAGEED